MLRQDVGEGKAKQLPGLVKRRVLVVDEDLDDLLYYSAVLQRHGFEVRSIPSYLDGSTCLEREDFDLNRKKSPHSRSCNHEVCRNVLLPGGDPIGRP